ncbi:MAG: GAP family protein [Microbacterium sp.]|nr:GAP family protein [Microbacterium sp.]
MELLGGLPLPLALAVLALVDGLSVGTLLIPVFLLLSPGRVRAGRILLYLATIAVFYLVVGLLFLWGLVNLVDVAADFLASPAGVTVRLLVGVALIVVAFVMPTKPAAPAAPGVAAPTPGRITRWRERLLDPRTRGTAVMAVAVAAGLVEVATMLPYILAMTMLADAGVTTPFRVMALVAYCALMVAPAVVLLVLRLVAAPLVQRPLERFAAWMERTGAENTAWIIGIIGFLVARSAAAELGIFQALDGFFGR